MNRPLRIFYAAADSATAQTPGSKIWYYNLYLPLVDLGHEVVRFDFDFSQIAPYRDFTVAANQAQIALNRPLLEKQLLTQLKKAQAERPFDLFFSYFYSADITADTLQQIKELGITTVNWYCNGSYQFHLVSDIAPFYDYCLVPEKFRLEDYRRVGANPIYCQEAANPTIYHPYNLPQEYDITFVGQKYGDRPVFIRHLFAPGAGCAGMGAKLARTAVTCSQVAVGWQPPEAFSQRSRTVISTPNTRRPLWPP
ncbi:MAG: hypothetical protein M5U34_11390 [Chloroflexi bacterium]|nr:hypothetical protein [Chloroflexota bacterium]